MANVIVQSRDILINITGASVARCCMAPERFVPARVNQHVMIIRVDPSKVKPCFVHAAINSEERKRQLLSYAQKASTREALTKETLSTFEDISRQQPVRDALPIRARNSFHTKFPDRVGRNQFRAPVYRSPRFTSPE
jgi:hypothetical protein